MPVYYDTNNIGDIYLGDNQIGEIYVDSDLVYSSNKIIDLGTGTSFNVKSKYAGWASLTLDNFFFTVASKATISGNEPSDIVYVDDGFTKTYVDGVLTMHTTVTDATSTANGRVHAYLVTKPSRLISLGSGKSFDASGYEGYQNFTADNFFIKSTSGNTVGGIRDPLQYTGSAEIVKQYNATTGALTCYLYGQFISGKDHSETWSHSREDDVQVYLNKKGV